MQKDSNEKITVVLIEDHKLMRVGLRSLFEKNNDVAIIGECETGKEGVEKVKIQKPDVVIIDVGLEDISGVEVAKRILNEQPDAKIMMLTSHLEEQTVIESLRVGVLAYVLKDVSSDMLTFIVKTVNLGAMWLDSKIVPIIRENSNSIVPIKTRNRANFKATHANLTEREFEVLKLVVDGKSNFEIAQILKISEHTSKAHVCNIIQKLVVDDRTQAAVKAIKEGLVWFIIITFRHDVVEVK